MSNLIDFLLSSIGYEYALTLPIEQILILSSVNSKINLNYSQNDKFWKTRFHIDFVQPWNVRLDPKLTWMQNYNWYKSIAFDHIAETMFQPTFPIDTEIEQIEIMYKMFFKEFSITDLDPEQLESSLINYQQKLYEFKSNWHNYPNILFLVFNQIFNEMLEDANIALNIVRTLNPSEYQGVYLMKTLSTENEILSNENIVKYIQLFKLPYINDKVASRRILSILGSIGGIKFCPCGGRDIRASFYRPIDKNWTCLKCAPKW